MPTVQENHVYKRHMQLSVNRQLIDISVDTPPTIDWLLIEYWSRCRLSVGLVLTEYQLRGQSSADKGIDRHSTADAFSTHDPGKCRRESTSPTAKSTRQRPLDITDFLSMLHSTHSNKFEGISQAHITTEIFNTTNNKFKGKWYYTSLVLSLALINNDLQLEGSVWSSIAYPWFWEVMNACPLSWLITGWLCPLKEYAKN